MVSVFRVGGAGDTLTGAGDILITDTMIMAIPMAMDIPTAMAMAMGTIMADTAITMATIANTALRLGREWLNCNGDFRGLAIIMDQLMEFWGLKLDGQFDPTRPITVMQTQAEPSC